VTQDAQVWRLGPPSHGGLYAHVCVGDKVTLLFEIGPPFPDRPEREELELRVLADDCPGGRRFCGELLSEPQRIPMARGARVLFKQMDILDWSSGAQPNAMALLADWWRRRTHQDKG